MSPNSGLIIEFTLTVIIMTSVSPQAKLKKPKKGELSPLIDAYTLKARLGWFE